MGNRADQSKPFSRRGRVAGSDVPPRWGVLGIAGLLIAFVFFRLLGAYWLRDDINPDYGIVALMARHIAAGQAWPVFFYGQAYMGSLEPIVSGLISRVIGFSGFSVCLGTVLFSIAMAPFIYRLGQAGGSWRSGSLALLFCVIGPSGFFHYTASARGGYAVMLFATVALLWALANVAWREMHARPVHWACYAAIGIGGGLAWWSHQLVTPAILAGALLYLLTSGTRTFKRPRVYLAAGGFFVGSLPFWWWNIKHGWQSLGLDAPRALPPVHQGLRLFWTRLVALLDLAGQPRWVFGLFSVVYGIGVLLWLRHFTGHWRRDRGSKTSVYLTGILLYVIVFIATFSLSRFSTVDSPRYLLPLVPILAVIMATGVERFRKPWAQWAWTGIILALVGWQAVHLPLFYRMNQRAADVRRVSAELADYLSDHGIEHIYTLYPETIMNWMLGERFVFVNLTGERHAPYETAIERADDPAVMNGYGFLADFLRVTRGSSVTGGPAGYTISHALQRTRDSLVEIDHDMIESIQDAWGNDVRDRLLDRYAVTGWQPPAAGEDRAYLTVNFTEPRPLAGLRILCGTGQYARQWRIAGRLDDTEAWRDLIPTARLSSFFWSGPRVYHGGTFFRKEAFWPPAAVRHLRIFLLPQHSPLGVRVTNLQFFEKAAEQQADEPAALNTLTNGLRDLGADRIYADRWLSNRLSQMIDGDVVLDRRNPAGQWQPRRVTLSENTVFVVRREDEPWNRTVFETCGLDMARRFIGPWTIFYFEEDQWDPAWQGEQDILWQGFGALIEDGKRYAVALGDRAMQSYRQHGDIEDAIRWMRQAVRVYPAYRLGVGRLADWLRDAGQLQEAAAWEQRHAAMGHPEIEAEARFGRHISLHGVTLNNATLAAGDRLRMRYFWRCQTEAELGNLLVFVHFRRDGHNRFQDDHAFLPERNVTYQPFDEIFVEDRSVDIPDDLDPGRYEIHIGLYDRRHVHSRLPVNTELPNRRRAVRLPVDLHIESIPTANAQSVSAILNLNVQPLPMKGLNHATNKPTLHILDRRDNLAAAGNRCQRNERQPR